MEVIYFKGNSEEVLELVQAIVESTADKQGRVLDYIKDAKEIKNDLRTVQSNVDQIG